MIKYLYGVLNTQESSVVNVSREGNHIGLLFRLTRPVDSGCKKERKVWLY